MNLKQNKLKTTCDTVLCKKDGPLKYSEEIVGLQ